MKKIARLLIVLTPLLFVSCVMSEQPLTNEETSKFEAKLIGSWQLVNPGGKRKAMTIGKKADSPNVMEWVDVSLNSRQEVTVKRYDVYIKPGKIGYISVAIHPTLM